MTLLTIFTVPKSFSDAHIATIQRNALQSWLQLGPEVNVLLIGEETGMVETANEFGIKHLPDVERNVQGTPLISSIFELARRNSNSPLLAYVNSDILIMPGLIMAAEVVNKSLQHFLLVGQRWDLAVEERIEFTYGWNIRLDQWIKESGSLHPPAGSDYFIFPRDCFTDVPGFAIGRAGWDNWMIYKARRVHWPVVDATRDVTIVHQNHDYSHLPGGQPHYKLPETDENIKLAGGREMTRFTLLDANRRLVDGRLLRRLWTGATLRRAVESYPLLAWKNYSLTERITMFFLLIRAKMERK